MAFLLYIAAGYVLYGFSMLSNHFDAHFKDAPIYTHNPSLGDIVSVVFLGPIMKVFQSPVHILGILFSPLWVPFALLFVVGSWTFGILGAVFSRSQR